jgi:hypothetical protein
VIVTFADGAAHIDFRRVAFDIPGFIEQLKASGNPSWEWTASLLPKS